MDRHRSFLVQVSFWNNEELVATNIAEKDSIPVFPEPLFPALCIPEGLVCSENVSRLLLHSFIVDRYAVFNRADMNITLRKCNLDSGLSELLIDREVDIVPDGDVVIYT